MKWLLCFWKGHHDPKRAHCLGGFKCKVCGKLEADLDGFDPGVPQGYINPIGRIYDRESGGVERSTRWEHPQKEEL